MVKILLFVGQNYIQVENSCIINATIEHLLDSERFNGRLLYSVNGLNDLKVLMITCFLLIFFNSSVYDRLLGTSLYISRILSMNFLFVLIHVL